MNAGTIFDNIILTDSFDEADAARDDFISYLHSVQIDNTKKEDL